MAVDQDVLFHILFNLAGNAIKFSPQGAATLLAALQRIDGVEFVVVDQGPGFSVGDLPYLFQKHRRLSARPTSGERSTGMGLYTTRLLSNLIGACIQLLPTVPEELGDQTADFQRIGAVWSVFVPANPTDQEQQS